MISYKTTTWLRAAILLMLGIVLAACNAAEQSETDQEVVTTDLTTYMAGQNVVVTYDNMQGAATDWIALARTTDNNQTFWVWQYTGGGTSGQVTFTAPALAQGTYEARAYYDWYGTLDYTIQQRSVPFTVAGNAMLSASSASYALGAPVVINFTGFSGSTTDWVSIHKPGTADNDYVDWQYTGGGANGSVTYNNIPTGTYEARYHADWATTNSYATSATSPQFTVGGAPAVTTDRLTYGLNEIVTVTYSNLPGNMLDYVAVSAAGSPGSSTIQRFYTNGAINGSQAFIGLPAGNYEARAYVNDSTTIIAMSTFTVTSASVSTDAANYPPNSTVTVTYAGMSSNPQDWIAISAAGSSDFSYVDFVYTGGMAMGTAQFANLPSGTYEARAYAAGTFNVVARSPLFTIGQACNVTTSPVFESLATGEVVIAANAVSATVPLTVALDRSIMFTSVREREQSPQHGAVACNLHAADATAGTPAGITCVRNVEGTDTMGSNGSVAIRWTVATFTSGVTVQRGFTKTYPTNPINVTLTTIDPASSFVVMNGVFVGGTGWGNNEFTRARIVDATTLELGQNSVGAEVAWQVVSMIGASVQRGTTSLATAATSQSASITDVPSGSLILSSYTADNSSGIGANALMMHASFQGSNAILFERSAGGAALDIAWEVVSLPFATRVGSTSFAAGVGARTESITGISAMSSVAISTVQSILGQSGGMTGFGTTDLVGEGAATMTTGTDSLVLERASTTSTAQIPWTVIDFAHDCAGN